MGKGGKGGGSDVGKGKGGGSRGQRRGGAPWSEEERQGDWDCRICGLPSNRAWRSHCRGCESKRYLNKPGGGKARDKSPKPVDPPRTFAERQLQRQKEEQQEQRRRSIAANRELSAKVERLEEELARARGGRQEGGGDGGDDGGEDCDGDDFATTNDYASWTADERQQRLDLAKAGLPYLVSRHGEDSPEAEAARMEIDDIQRAAREAKPFKAHRNQLEQKRDRLHKQQNRDEQELVRIQEERAQLQEKHDTIKKAVDDRAKALAKIEEELTELIKKSLAENVDSGSKQTPCIAPAAIATMSTALQALEAMAAQSGVPPELAAILAHIRSAANGMAAAAAAVSPQPPAQQGPPQRHPQQQSTIDKGTGNDKGKGGGGGDSGNGGVAAAQPVQLAPQARWARSGAANAGGGDGAKPADGGGAAGTATGNNEGDKGNGGGTGDPETRPPEGDPTVAAMDVDMEIDQSLRKLPSADQERLRAALGARGGRRRNEKTDDNEAAAAGSRDRERSPRMLKGGGDEGDL